MDNRELLEMAAKAFGIENPRYHPEGWLPESIEYDDEEGNTQVWCPHTDDGDGARMEAKLKLNVEWCGSYVMVTDSQGFERCSLELNGYEDHQATRRRASLRVAAEIGRKM